MSKITDLWLISATISSESSFNIAYWSFDQILSNSPYFFDSILDNSCICDIFH